MSELSLRPVGVYSMKGGVGKSTVALLLGHHLAEAEPAGRKVAILDFDLTGTSLDRALPDEAKPDAAGTAEGDGRGLDDFLTWYPDGVEGADEPPPRRVRLATDRGGLVLFPSEAPVGAMAEVLPFLYRERQTGLFHDRLQELLTRLDKDGVEVAILDNVPGRAGLVEVTAELVGAHGGQHVVVSSADVQDLAACYELVNDLWRGEREDGGSDVSPGERFCPIVNRIPEEAMGDLGIERPEQWVEALRPAVEIPAGGHPLLRADVRVDIAYDKHVATLFTRVTEYPGARRQLTEPFRRAFERIEGRLGLGSGS